MRKKLAAGKNFGRVMESLICREKIELSGLTGAIRQQEARQRKKERELLEGIAALSDYETAQAAADIYTPREHAYSFDGYLHQLSKLQTVLKAGIPANAAMEAVDTCLDADMIIRNYRDGK